MKDDNLQIVKDQIGHEDLLFDPTREQLGCLLTLTATAQGFLADVLKYRNSQLLLPQSLSYAIDAMQAIIEHFDYVRKAYYTVNPAEELHGEPQLPLEAA